ncbi:MAG: methyltransferase domain-containing protein, partial [Actinomycetota bacterium]
MSDIREEVRARYAEAAEVARGGSDASCCEGSCCGDTAVLGAGLYGSSDTEVLPETALLASLGCGNPTAVAELKEGDTVLDLGSGGGIDVLLSARRVGPAGKAYGLDMTDEMLTLALKNKDEAGVDNVEFLKGYIEAIP